MRPSWEEYFMQIAEQAATRSTCLRRQIGAVIVKENQILATGYNDVPTKVKHCSVTGCIRQHLNVPSGERHELCRGIHAEQNAIVQAAKFGISIKDADLYVTAFPCVVCAKMIINAGIKTVVYYGDYPDSLSKDILAETSIILKKGIKK